MAEQEQLPATVERARKEQERNAKWMEEHAEEWAEKKAQQLPPVRYSV